MMVRMSRMIWAVWVLCLGVAAHAQMGHRNDHGGMHRGRQAVSMARHHYVHEHGIDAAYAGKVSPLAPTAQDLERGRDLFQRACASCHGPRGLGDGEAGAALTPAPSNLAWINRRPIATDAYLYWTIAEGGAPIGSAMPPFKEALGETEIWDIIAHLRQL